MFTELKRGYFEIQVKINNKIAKCHVSKNSSGVCVVCVWPMDLHKSSLCQYLDRQNYTPEQLDAFLLSGACNIDHIVSLHSCKHVVFSA